MAEERIVDPLQNVDGTVRTAPEELDATLEDQRKTYEKPTVVFVPQEALEALKDVIGCPISLNCL